ncbi:MAG: TIGR03621 family F420-dependent LLM class oxidoreductase [Acidimicrobiales bacterium]
MPRPIRFGYQLTRQQENDPIAAAKRAEQIGFNTFLVSDHFGSGRAPMPTLAAVAAATSSIRLGTFVLNTDMRNPVQLAWEAATIDHLSGGRFELGLGAGHTPQEYGATGIEFRVPADRKADLAEQVEIIRRLLAGDSVTHNGTHHRLSEAEIDRSLQERLPILVGGNGNALLSHAGAHADIVGLQGLGRTLEDGHRHDVKWSAEWLDTQLEQIRSGAAERFAEIELNALVQHVEVTDDAAGAIEAFCERVGTVVAADVATTPYVLIGTVEEIVEKITTCRDRWGISYFAARELDDFAPIIEAFR